MSWCRAVWLERENEEEGVIPSCWVNAYENIVYWPTNLNVLRAFKERKVPDNTWKKFRLLKMKMSDGKPFFIILSAFYNFIPVSIILQLTAEMMH